MQKVRTLFKRDETTKKVYDEFAMPLTLLIGAVATEKVDGTNVRLTVRNDELVRVEARRNPTKAQKQRGVIEPWYRDAWIFGGGDPVKADQYIVEAAQATVADAALGTGEWSGEAVGPSIQGNPLELEERRVVLFDHPAVRHARLEFMPGHAPTLDFDGLRDWLRGSESLVSPGHPIEGIVWWARHGIDIDGSSIGGWPVAKIKTKDFA